MESFLVSYAVEMIFSLAVRGKKERDFKISSFWKQTQTRIPWFCFLGTILLNASILWNT